MPSVVHKRSVWNVIRKEFSLVTDKTYSEDVPKVYDDHVVDTMPIYP